MKLSNAKLRTAMSLIELVAAMSACSVILTTCAVLLHRVMRADSDARAFGDIERNAARLSNRFRDDVHQASVASLDHSKTDNEDVLKLKLPKDQSLEYSCAVGRVSRVLTQNGKVTARGVRISAAVEVRRSGTELTQENHSFHNDADESNCRRCSTA